MIAALSIMFFFFKQKTAYEMRISDWSSDVCSSDLAGGVVGVGQAAHVDDAQLLPQRLAGDGDARRGAAGEHDDAVLLDHPPGRGAAAVDFGWVLAVTEGGIFQGIPFPFNENRPMGFRLPALPLPVVCLPGGWDGGR